MKTFTGIALALLMGGVGVAGGVVGTKTYYDKQNNEAIQVKDGEISELSTKLAELQESLTTKEEELIALKITNKSLTDEKISLQTQIAEKDATILDLEEQLEQAESDSTVNELQAQLDAERMAKSQLETQLAEKTSRIEQLESTISTKEESLTQAQAQLAELQSSFNVLQESYNGLAIENSGNKEQLNSLTGEIAVLNARIAELESQLEKDPNKEYLFDQFEDYYVSVLKLSEDIVFASHHTLSVSGDYGDKNYEAGLFRVGSDYSLTKIYDKGSRWEYGYSLCDGRVVVTSLNSKSVLIVDTSNNNCKAIEAVAGFRCFFNLSNGNCCLSTASSSNPGLYELNIQTDTITQIYDAGYGFDRHIEIDENNVLFSSSAYAVKGLFLLELSNHSITTIDSIYSKWTLTLRLSNGNVILYSSNTSGDKYPLSLYDVSQKTLTSLRNGDVIYSAAELDSGKIVIGGFFAGLEIININTLEKTPLGVSGSKWGNFYKLKNGKVLMSCILSDRAGLHIFDEADNSLTKIYGNGYSWDVFIESESGVTIQSSKYPEFGTIYYNYSDGMVTKVS